MADSGICNAPTAAMYRRAQPVEGQSFGMAQNNSNEKHSPLFGRCGRVYRLRRF
jgi:hypothetical protein